MKPTHRFTPHSIPHSTGADASAVDASGTAPQDLIPEGPDDEDIKEILDKTSGRKGKSHTTAASKKTAVATKPAAIAEEPPEKRFAKMPREEQLRKVRFVITWVWTVDCL